MWADKIGCGRKLSAKDFSFSIRRRWTGFANCGRSIAKLERVSEILKSTDCDKTPINFAQFNRDKISKFSTFV